MRKYVLISFLVFATSFAYAQQVKIYPGSDAGKHINESVYIADTVKEFKIINQHLKYLDLGGKYPKQKLTVILKGDEIKINPNKLKNHLVIVHGTVVMYKSKPRITVTDSTAIKIQKTPTD